MDDHHYCELSIEGVSVGLVRSMRGQEAVSTLFRYEVDVELGLPLPDLATVMGAEATLTMKDASGVERRVFGLVAEADIIAYDTARGGGGKFVIRPHAYRQSLGRDCVASQDMGALDVVRQILSDYTYPIRFEVVGSYPTYPYRVQYREDDWTYLSRLLEEEGIYYWFDHDANSEVVFADNSVSSPAITGNSVLSFVAANQMQPKQACVIEASFSSSAAPHVFTSRSFDLKKPDKTIEARVGSGPHEYYDAPGGGTHDPVILHSRVRVGLEGAHAAKASMNGATTSVALYPGRSFELMLHPVAALDGELFVTHVEVSTDSGKVPVTARFRAIRRDVPFRPPRTSKVAKQAGLQMGAVVGPDGQEVHPDSFGRIRVQAHWDRLGPGNEKGGTWMRIAQRGAPGSMLLPRMGWNVAFFNEEGGVDAPSTVCRIHDGDHPPEYDLPANKTRTVYKTATTPGGGSHNEIYFEDKGGAEEMFVHASHDMNVRTKDKKQENIFNDSLRHVGENYVLHVDASMTEKVFENQTVAVGANEDLTVHDKYTKSVTANETRTIGGSRSLKSAESHTGVVSGNRNLSVGAAQIDISLGQISTTVPHAITMVGGVVLRASAASILEDTTKLGFQLIGGARVDMAKLNHPLDVGKLLMETVGGTMFLKSSGKYLDTSEKTSSWTVLGALTADAPEVWTEATKKIVIKCGGSSITIIEGEIRIEADNLDLAGAHLDADTKGIVHN